MTWSLRQPEVHVHLSLLRTSWSSVFVGFLHEACLDQTVRHLYECVSDLSWFYLQNLPHLEKETNYQMASEYGPGSW